jgi:hypothetical protein
MALDSPFEHAGELLALLCERFLRFRQLGLASTPL